MSGDSLVRWNGTLLPSEAGTAGGTIIGMAMNLRLRPDAEAAVRAEAARVGRSQQALIRQAVDQYLGLEAGHAPRSDAEALLAAGAVRPARTAFREADTLLRLQSGLTTHDLLDRDDRV